MSNVYKVFSKVILKRITPTLDTHQPKEQAGFRSNFSTTDHIHVVKQKAIWTALKLQGIGNKHIRILQNLYLNCKSAIKIESIGPKYLVERGARQGDPISSKLFCAVLEMVFRNLEWGDRGLSIDGVKISHLMFTDDIVVFSEFPIILEKMI